MLTTLVVCLISVRKLKLTKKGEKEIKKNLNGFMKSNCDERLNIDLELKKILNVRMFEIITKKYSCK